ncbi:MAG: hypothetical protein AAF850_12185 [Pseudomonadota bacterium]
MPAPARNAFNGLALCATLILDDEEFSDGRETENSNEEDDETRAGEKNGGEENDCSEKGACA